MLTQRDAMNGYSAEELCELGLHYIDRGDEKRGRHYILEAARASYARAYCVLADTYTRGGGEQGADADDRARQYIELGARAGDAEALCRIGERCANSKQYDKAAQYFRQAAAQDHGQAMTRLAFLIHREKVKACDHTEQSPRLLEEAAALGDSRAMRTLARSCLIHPEKEDEGWGSDRFDPVRAMRLYERAAEQGDLISIGQLAIYAVRGLVTKRDFDKADKWLEKLSQVGGSSSFAVRWTKAVSNEVNGDIAKLVDAGLLPSRDNEKQELTYLRNLYFKVEECDRTRGTLENLVGQRNRYIQICGETPQFKPRRLVNIGYILWFLTNARLSLYMVSLFLSGAWFGAILVGVVCVLSWLWYYAIAGGLFEPFRYLLSLSGQRAEFEKDVKRRNKEDRMTVADIDDEIVQMNAEDQQAQQELKGAHVAFQRHIGYDYPARYCTRAALRFICECMTNLRADTLVGPGGAFQMYEDELKNRELLANSRMALRHERISAWTPAQVRWCRSRQHRRMCTT